MIGTEKSWGKSAADGVVARDAKSGAFLFHIHGLISPSRHETERGDTCTMRVAILLMHDMRLITIAHPNSEPCTVAGWEMMGPTPFALTIHQIKKMMPAAGATMALSVKRWRLEIAC